jgi:hypothetical protein
MHRPSYSDISHGFRGTEVENCTEPSDRDDMVARSLVHLYALHIFWVHLMLNGNA